MSKSFLQVRDVSALQTSIRLSGTQIKPFSRPGVFFGFSGRRLLKYTVYMLISKDIARLSCLHERKLLEDVWLIKIRFRIIKSFMIPVQECQCGAVKFADFWNSIPNIIFLHLQFW